MSANAITIAVFVVLIGLTLGITIWASRQDRGAAQHLVAGGKIKAWQNGIAIAGDFLSAATFLGVAGLVAIGGFAGFYLGAGGVIAYITLLVLVSGPLRNLGKFTTADALTSRFNAKGVRATAALASVAILIPYMIAQLVGAGSIIQLLTGIDYSVSVIVIGVLMAIYITAGGMLATTWIQITQAVLLIGGIFVLLLFLLARFNFNPVSIFNEVDAQVGREVLFAPRGGLEGLGWVSYNVTFLLGAVGLPHILIRFFTVPDAKAARTSAAVSLWIVAFALVATPILGYGAMVIVGQEAIAAAGEGGNMTLPLLAEALGGPVFIAFISAAAFAAILSTLAGIVIASSGTFAHDLYNNVLRNGEASERELVRTSRLVAVLVPIFAILCSLAVQNVNIAILIAVPLVFAASAIMPVLLLTIYWKRFNRHGVIAGLLTGLIAPLILLLLSPSVMGENALSPFDNPGLITVPLGFLACYLGTVLSGTRAAEERERGEQVSWDEIYVRANTGIGKVDLESEEKEPVESRT